MAEQGGKSKKTGERRRRRVETDCADWGSANAELLQRVIEVATAGGGAIRFGYSRDGGAYSVGIYGDGKPFTEFLPGPADVDEWLEGFRVDYE